MKKALFTLAMVLMGTIAHAQSIDKFISQFEGNNDAQVIRMDKNMIKKELADDSNDEEDRKLAEKADSMNVLVISSDNGKTAEQFDNTLPDLEKEGYERMINVNQDASKVKILSKTNETSIKEIIVIVSDNKQRVFVQIFGNIKPEEVEKMVQINQTKWTHRYSNKRFCPTAGACMPLLGGSQPMPKPPKTWFKRLSLSYG